MNLRIKEQNFENIEEMSALYEQKVQDYGNL